MRRNVYWSERLDRDLITYMSEHNFDIDFSRQVRNLMRDGIKFREEEIINGKRNTNVFQTQLPKPKSPLGTQGVQKEQRGEVKMDFSDITTKKKEVDLKELDDRLNSI